MNNYYYGFNESMKIKVYDDGRLINTVEIRFDDYDKTYDMIDVYGPNYDYYEDRYFD